MLTLVPGHPGEAAAPQAAAAPFPPYFTADGLHALCQHYPVPLVAVAALAPGQPAQCYGTALAAVPGLAPGPFAPPALHAALHPADKPLLLQAHAWARQFVQQHPDVAASALLSCRLRLLAPDGAVVVVLHCVPLATLRAPHEGGPWLHYFQRFDHDWKGAGFRFGFGDARFWPWLRRLLKAGKQLRLTPREEDVLRLLLQGFSNAAIADRLFIDYKTVLSHHRNLLSKAPDRHLPALAWLLPE